jgi:hypothetical protein
VTDGASVCVRARVSTATVKKEARSIPDATREAGSWWVQYTVLQCVDYGTRPEGASCANCQRTKETGSW